MNQIEVKLPAMEQIWQSTFGWQPNQQQQEQFQRLYEAILLGNRQLNLTRITTPEDFWEKHLWDSLTGVENWLQKSNAQENFQVIDIGTGAGFPGLAIAIAFPNWQITLLDSTRKKVAFLETVIAQLGLSNVKTLVGRVEAIGQNSLYREVYHLACIRAVGQASVCAEYALPLVNDSGLAILYRGHWLKEENTLLNLAAIKLGGNLEKIQAWTTPLSKSDRHCIYLRKNSPTPKHFPRAIGIPNQQPL
jgi:16S rRNA (guanine527-N7)-methyltransferase